MTKILKNFWVLEGLDGSGTTTQLKNLEEELKKRKKKYFITQEPTVYETGIFLRRVLKGEIDVSQSTIAYLFAADRDNHIYNAKDGILKHINDGQIVVSDRYMFSSLAYQSIGYPYEKIKSLNEDFPLPEYVIYIDTPAEECINRINNRGEEKEIFEKLDFQKKVILGYERCFRDLPSECQLLRIDGTLSKEEVFEEIKRLIFKDNV